MDKLEQVEYTASDIRIILQRLFPHRRLVLSQFTFFNQSGVAKPSGESFRRGRRCYRMYDLLPIACVLALKEEGIPLKNIDLLPALLQTKAEVIFSCTEPCRLSGFAGTLALEIPGHSSEIVDIESRTISPIDRFCDDIGGMSLFWSFDVNALARQIERVIYEPEAEVAQFAVG